MNIKSLIVTGILVSGVATGIQLEVNNLNKTLESLRASDAQALTTALSKFERDLFGRMAAQENARQAALAEQDAARRRDIDQGLKGLPNIWSHQ